MSRLLPAPDAPEPTVTVAPGNLLTADSSIPDSRAGGSQYVDHIYGLGENVPESLTPAPCLGLAVLGSRPCTFARELRSASACLAMSRGFWPLYSADMIDTCDC
jgi:hypothetical protein